MSAMIDMSNRRANIAWIGATPWHKLGTEMPEDADLDQWRIAAGMDWKVERAPVEFSYKIPVGSGTAAKVRGKVPARHVLFRSDTKLPLSVVSNRYKIVQPAEVIEFYRDLLEGSQYTMDVAGVLDQGQRVWALARSTAEIRIAGQDLIKPYLLLATSYDGTMSTVASLTSVRVVCNNTLQMAVGRAGKQADIRVPHSTNFDARQVKLDLGVTDEAIGIWENDVNELAQKPMSRVQAAEFYTEYFAQRDDKGNITNEKRLKKLVPELLHLYEAGPGAELRSARGTAWGVVNAFTHWADFKAGAHSDENRIKSASFGANASKKADIFRLALAA